MEFRHKNSRELMCTFDAKKANMQVQQSVLTADQANFLKIIEYKHMHLSNGSFILP